MIMLHGPSKVAIETSLLVTVVSLGEGGNQYTSDYKGEKSREELIRPIGRARVLFRELRVLKTVCSVARSTRASFSAVGDALAAGKSCDSCNEEAKDEHCETKMSVGHCKA